MLRHSGLRGSERLEAVGLHLERHVQQVIEVLDCVRQRELRDLALVEVLRQLGETGVADDLRARGFLDVGERRSFAGAEQGAAVPVGERIEALRAEPAADCVVRSVGAGPVFRRFRG